MWKRCCGTSAQDGGGQVCAETVHPPGTEIWSMRRAAAPASRELRPLPADQMPLKQPHPPSLPKGLGRRCGGFHDSSVAKNPPAVQEPYKTRVRSLSGEYPVKEGTASHSSILAWRIPRTEKPGGLQSTESQRVRQAWSDLAHPLPPHSPATPPPTRGRVRTQKGMGETVCALQQRSSHLSLD